MPLRVIEYDGAEYRYQLLKENKMKARYPVVTLVLYFGYKHRWNKPLSLLERLEVPEEFKPYVQDYKINLFEIAYMDREDVKKFKSDFRIVADYFVQMRENNDYKPSKEEIKHVQETLHLLRVLVKDRRFEEVNRVKAGEKGEVRNMCEVIDKFEARGIAIGEARGKGIGKEIGKGLGETLMGNLIKILMKQGKMKELERAAEDEEYRHKLIEELGITV